MKTHYKIRLGHSLITGKAFIVAATQELFVDAMPQENRSHWVIPHWWRLWVGCAGLMSVGFSLACLRQYI